MAVPDSRADPVLERLKGLHPKVIDLSLDRVHRLLAALGHPERRLPPVLHVAGTNGKGSTLAFARAMLEAAGHRVHVYTSPHLVRFHERIRLAGRLITDAHLAALLEECEAANDGGPITFFEVTTAAAFLAFAREPADAVLLETGLGGRLDATNVLDRPAVTAITRISYDHRQFLGDTIEAIAGEKAGILKPGVPAVLAPQPDSGAARVLAGRAAAIGAPVHPWSVEPTASGFRFESPRRCLDLPRPGL
ncbi:MAG TPA: Mur ligase family protein, partial [Azospirillum sp.]